ncbi:MAG: NifU family protein [Phycisphaerales bacterium]|jgi:Fe-S cluster biogenesis protein NfuA|nr:NifU family protein [Phycisphaerales bacterium]MDP6311616.1 NifU family protein [Phycisphaerales bacterium]MDP7086043.1 NifU family protein [Phycisphaerales bacterium]MDP7188925.1 NifU family protein [Phycisphaerales bacterium]MDP7519209.1 NifU family protein [Phycisphaerales bacterium]|tara:strand:+ start:264 stop:518 length:255 start_codon:yes stop_codon:yes gene_type:complete
MTEASEQPSPLLTRVEQVLEAIRPAIQADGGDLELVDVTGEGEVHIRLLGACIDCPSAHLTLEVGIEQNLMARIPEVTKVLAVD